jgi:hypothetical protein
MGFWPRARRASYQRLAGKAMLKWATALSRRKRATAGPIGRDPIDRWAVTRWLVAWSKCRYVPTTGEVTTGFFAKERARIAAACARCSAERVAFQRKRLTERSIEIDSPAVAGADM